MTLTLSCAAVVAFIVFLQEPQQAVAARSARESTHGALMRSDPGMDPWVERDIPSPGTSPERGSQSDASGSNASRSGSAPHQSRQEALPLQEDDYPLPTDEQLQATNHPRHYHLPTGAIMSLSIGAIGLKNVPVMNSDSTRALDQGVVHLPDTSLPWYDTPERNAYLAGHRLGWPGTGSHLVFYRLNQLDAGDRITLRDREGRRYDYKVLETFTVEPRETWVTGRVRGRDLLTLQTCTPIPTFQWRLIVRAERV
jgi:sortase A